MARPRSNSRENLIHKAMLTFWRNGYHGTSIESLVQATRVARAGIYKDFGGKTELFKACMTYYRNTITGPAIMILKSQQTGLEAIEDYLQYFVELHKKNGLPGPGCFVGNTMTEIAPHNEEIRALVEAHNQELHDAFYISLRVANKSRDSGLTKDQLDEFAMFLVTSTQGLWSYARAITSLAILENFVASLMELLKTKFPESKSA